jgi:hypothetical protein
MPDVDALGIDRLPAHPAHPDSKKEARGEVEKFRKIQKKKQKREREGDERRRWVAWKGRWGGQLVQLLIFGDIIPGWLWD